MLFWYDNHVVDRASLYGAISGCGHTGIDVQTKNSDTNVRATVGGHVLLVEAADVGPTLQQHGTKVVCVQDKSGFRHYYGGITPAVYAGQQVNAGDVLGRADGNASTTAGRVHYEVRWGRYTSQETVEPTLWCGIPNEVGTHWNHPGEQPVAADATPVSVSPPPSVQQLKNVPLPFDTIETSPPANKINTEELPAVAAPIQEGGAAATGIEFYRNHNRQLNDAIDRLVIKTHYYQEKYNHCTVLITGCGAGNGTSMVAINLAIALSLAGRRTLLVDADLRKTRRFKRLGKEVQNGISAYLEGTAPLNEVLYDTNFERLKYAPCGTANASPVRLLCSGRVDEFIAACREQFDFVIFDSPAVTVVPDATILFPAVDGVALIASLNKTSKKQLADAKRAVEKYSDKYYGIIINNVDQQQYGTYFPQDNNFDKKVLRRKYRKWLRRDSKQEVKG